jgi:hypothetical protein
MPRLYVANCTKQNQIVYFRLDFMPDGAVDPRAAMRMLPRSQPIPTGRQVCLGGDLEIKQIEEVVKQLNRYGMQGTVDLGRLPRARTVPYLFNIDVPCTVNQIKAVLAHNGGVLRKEGADRRQALAVVANASAEEHGAEAFEVSIETEDDAEMGDTIAEGFRIDVNAPPPAKRGPGRPRRRTAAA